MTELMWVRSHVEVLLGREWEGAPVPVDADGDIPVRWGTAACWVSVLEADVGPMVHVWAHAACGVKASAKSLRELNDIQNRALSARVSLSDGCVIVSQVISPIGLTQPVLMQALRAVGGLAHEVGPLLAALFDGRTPYPTSPPGSEQSGSGRPESEDEEAA